MPSRITSLPYTLQISRGLGFVHFEQAGIPVHDLAGDVVDVVALVEIFGLGKVQTAELAGANREWSRPE